MDRSARTGSSDHSTGPKMRILLLSKYDRLGASSRIRSYQYLPYLEAHDIDVTIAPLLGNPYIERLYSSKSKNTSYILKSYSNRIKNLLRFKEFDTIWVEKEFLPWFPAVIPYLMQYIETPYLVDYDDAVFHRYDNHSSKFVRSVLGTKIDTVMKHADVVTVGNDYLADRAERAGANRIEYLPTVVDLDRYNVREPNNNDFTVGWIGTPNTARYLSVVEEPLRKLSKEGSVNVVLVGSGKVGLEGIPTEIRTWSEDTEVRDIQSFDVGIMPLPDGPVQRGKCGYKLIQYMACGKPVIASPVGINKSIVDPENGLLADSTDEWFEAFSTLRNNPSKAEEMGRNGREKVEKKYCYSVTAPRLLSIMQSL